ncbi:Emopamil-binding protein [Hyaloscypha bicolor E]|uniref:Emopamil-binding protein n=1 Tax=Hyaloscypha bicolor E TaxID=1095630 RepID=A0A2J6SHL1_9HELO|nr:Emopamil-binding protein [Hyaloscypha bicolor E]PMD50243.1 Emopamil-binding protein [Hyaloscypha bicolor E]
MVTADNFTMLPPSHPYYPEGVLLSEEFIGNTWSVPTLILTFATGCALLLFVTFVAVRHANPALKPPDQWKVLWFVLTGSIHVFFEGYFVYNHSRMPSMQDFFGQLWKEYALSDSRYMSSDSLVLCTESLTVLTWGPLSLLTAVLITRQSQFRHPVQALVSTGHFYGNLIYYSTCLYEGFALGKRYYRPEPYYFWWYFVLMNTFWLVIPAICLSNSISASANAFAVADKVNDGPEKKRT